MTQRTYTQVARAESTERTRRSILDAANALFREHGLVDPELDLVAARAGVSTRTLLRHFGSKEGLIEASMADGQARVARAREAEAGDVDTAIRRLVDHYEEMGDSVMRLLAEEDRRPAVRRVTEEGKAMHREWVAHVFAPDLEPLAPGPREHRAALLATATDVFVWALLRRRYGLGRDATEAAIRGLVDHARGEQS
jgi:AcrR family transcriptional regulator